MNIRVLKNAAVYQFLLHILLLVIVSVLNTQAATKGF